MPARNALRSLGRWWAGCLTVAIIAAIAVFLAACEERLSGVYREDNGFGSLEFRSDGTVYVTVGLADSTFLAEYELDGAKIIITGPSGSQVFTIASDGAIEGAMGMRYRSVGTSAPG